MSVQRIVEDSPAIELQAEAQHTSGEIETPVRKQILRVISDVYFERTQQQELNDFKKSQICYFSPVLY